MRVDYSSASLRRRDGTPPIAGAFPIELDIFLFSIKVDDRHQVWQI